MRIKFKGQIKDVDPVYAKRLINSGKAESVTENKKAGRPKSNKGESESDKDK